MERHYHQAFQTFSNEFPLFQSRGPRNVTLLVNILTRCFCYATRNLTRLRVVYLATRNHGRIVAVLANHKRAHEAIITSL